jgi:hypothetical protein
LRRIKRHPSFDGPSSLALGLPRFPTSGVVDVKDLDHIGGNAVKKLVRILNERNDANARTLLNLLRTLRPFCYAPLDCANPSFKR